MRYVSKGTIEEGILKVAQEKLHLEKEVTSIKGLYEVIISVKFVMIKSKLHHRFLVRMYLTWGSTYWIFT